MSAEQMPSISKNKIPSIEAGVVPEELHAQFQNLQNLSGLLQNAIENESVPSAVGDEVEKRMNSLMAEK